jgi:protein TonB
MSYAVPFSLLSWHVPDHDESVAERLRWPLAGSALLHAVVFVALLSLHFGSSLEESSGSYEVMLVTLPEIVASPMAAPQRKAVIPPGKAARTTGPRSPVKARVPERAMDALVSVTKPQATAIPKVVTPPVSTDPGPILKQNVDRLPPPPLEYVREVPKPERVTESLVSALDAVVVPKPQPLPVPQASAPVRPLAPAPVEQSPAVGKDVTAFKAPPQPPKLVVGKPETPTPAPRAEPLAQKLKQRVDTIVVPKKPEQVSKRVSPAVASKRKQKPDVPKASESPAITLPSRLAPSAAVVQSEMRKKETPPQTVRKSSTVESLKEVIQSVRIPQRNPKSKTAPTKRAVPLVSETVSPAKAAETRNQSFAKIVPPQAPQLAEVQDSVPAQSAVSEPTSEPDTSGEEIAKLEIPEASAFDIGSVSKQTESGGEKARGLWKAGSCSPNNPYWENVEAKIDNIHGNIYRYHYRVESPAILTFRVERNGQVADLTVVRSSGNKKFDLVAKRAVRAAAPLPPFPANMTKPFCQVRHKFKIKPN